MAKERECRHIERMVLPTIGGEFDLHWAPRALVGGLFLLWFFMGVGIISDIFMGAIEKITARKVRVHRKEKNRWVTVKVWNDTMANLTLMALGSSAPEILLNVLEVLKLKFKSGELGPSTIVGSAAFNLLVISAVCVAGVDEVKKIKNTSVFIVTAAFSIFAYLWMLIVLSVWTKDEVTIIEAVLTFMFMFVLLALAYSADRGYFSSPAMRQEATTEHFTNAHAAELTQDELAELAMSVRSNYGDHLTDLEVALLIDRIHKPSPSKAQYSVMARRTIFGGKKVELGEKADKRSVCTTHSTGDDAQYVEDRKKAIMEFGAARYHVVESMGNVTISVVRGGFDGCTAFVKYRCLEGTAKEVSDYVPIDGELEFAPGERKKMLKIAIVDDTAFEDDEDFYVELYDARAEGGTCAIGDNSPTTITIIDDDDPGIFRFDQEHVNIPEQAKDRTVKFRVTRNNGCNGKVSCKYRTEDGSAKNSIDYEESEGILEFEMGQMTAEVEVLIKASRGRYLAKEEFRIILEEATGGARFDPNTDGGGDSNILTVHLESDANDRSKLDLLQRTVTNSWEKASIGHSNWVDQFRSSLYVNGSPEEQKEASIFDCVMHVLNFPWKVIFAFVPPVDYCGGWLCFCCSLLAIGGVTAYIGDLASLFGCLAGINEPITAITFVALGTSLPDTFASMMAAQQDEYADASVGNITGSNSVNVFLGLGLPWLMGSFYWAFEGKASAPNFRDKPEFKDGAFIVESGGLSISVAIFSICAFAGLFILYLRRRRYGGELGGPKVAKYLSAFLLLMLWVVYIAVASFFFLEEEKDKKNR